MITSRVANCLKRVSDASQLRYGGIATAACAALLSCFASVATCDPPDQTPNANVSVTTSYDAATSVWTYNYSIQNQGNSQIDIGALTLRRSNHIVRLSHRRAGK